jgi:poly(hydroxyalkanoate) depolymerase family esterase
MGLGVMWRSLVHLMRSDGLKPGAKSVPPRPVPPANPLIQTPFAPNPGNLRLFLHVPKGLKSRAPLVVVLHGCGQTAAGYGVDAGWCRLADELGFALLAPEQKAVNNPNTCFDWFNPEDITRDEGEVASIAAMIRSVRETYRLDERRVFITGLSAGGAMTAAMLATYPELFAGGAIIAGLPFGAAVNVREALEAMRSAPLRTPRQWGDAVRAASSFQGPWPKVSIWHGVMDTTVNINNAQASVAQWADLHDLGLTDTSQEMVEGAVRLSWGDQLELYTLPLLGHGVPIDSGDVGTPAPFILEAGISSSRRIAGFWGLAPAAVRASVPMPMPAPARPQVSALREIEATLAPGTISPDRRDSFIRRCLKAVGLSGKK